MDSNVKHPGFQVLNDNSSEQSDIATDLITLFNRLYGEKGNLNTHCTEIAERILPDDRFLFLDFATQMAQGEKRTQELYDSTGLLALERFTAIVDSLLTPRNSFWHHLKANDRTLMQNRQVKDYFERATEVLFETRYASLANFTSQNQMAYTGMGAYGTGTLYTDDNYTGSGLRYKNVHLSELYLQQNHQGIVDRVCRHFMLTARDAVQFFGDALPETIKAQADLNQEKQYFFLHWVMPRTDQDIFRKDYKGMPYASYYISIEGKKLLMEGGYNSFPYAICRYRQVKGEAYGRSIAMNVLPSIKTLNEQKKTILKQGHLSTDPIILAHDDGIIDLYDGNPGSIIPGGVTKNGEVLVHPMPVGNVQIGKELMDDERKLINDSFLVTLFQILVETPEMTATEVMERTREKGILLAPTIGRQQSEYLGPLIDRELDILSRQGVLPPMPQMLKDAKGQYKVVYDSPLTRTQKAEWAAGALRTVEQLMAVVQATQDPSILDYINWDIAAPQIAEIYGTPSTWLNDKVTIQQKRQARAQLMQQQQQIQAAPAQAGLMKAMQKQ